jgi:hypothetical protein
MTSIEPGETSSDRARSTAHAQRFGGWMRGSNAVGLCLCAGLLIIFAVTGSTAWLGKSATFDEPLHLTGAWIQTHYGDFRCNPEDPPLWKYYIAVGTKADALPVIRNVTWWKDMLRQMPSPAYFYSRHALFQTPGVDADGVIQGARARMLAVGVLLGAAIAFWAWRLRSPVAAVTATALYCFDPNFLAHAALIKNDVPITAAFVLFMMAIWLVGEAATLWRCISLTILLGVCLTVKFSGLLAIPMLLVAMLCGALIPRAWPVLKWNFDRFATRAFAAAMISLAALLVSYGFIWANYGFRFGPSPNPSVRFDFNQVVQSAMTGEVGAALPASQTGKPSDELVRAHRPGLPIQWVLFANEHRLLPQAYLMGLLYTYSTSLVRKTFLCGTIRTVGFWYYFPLTVLFKTPVATLVAFGLAAGVFIVGLFRPAFRKLLAQHIWAICALCIAPLLYGIVAMRSNLNIGIRHILPVYPFLYIAVGVAATVSLGRWNKLRKGALLALAFGLVVETYLAYPDYIPFFNAAVGGSRGGLSLLSDSNIDWGQELPALANWQHEHPEDQIFLFYFGVIDPHYYRLKYVELPGSSEAVPGEQPDPGLHPIFAISAVALQGTYLSPQHAAFFEQLRTHRPIAVLGGSIYLFDGVQISGTEPEAGDSAGGESIR